MSAESKYTGREVLHRMPQRWVIVIGERVLGATSRQESAAWWARALGAVVVDREAPGQHAETVAAFVARREWRLQPVTARVQASRRRGQDRATRVRGART